jgi:hypothetical protein
LLLVTADVPLSKFGGGSSMPMPAEYPILLRMFFPTMPALNIPYFLYSLISLHVDPISQRLDAAMWRSQLGL